MPHEVVTNALTGGLFRRVFAPPLKALSRATLEPVETRAIAAIEAMETKAIGNGGLAPAQFFRTPAVRRSGIRCHAQLVVAVADAFDGLDQHSGAVSCGDIGR